MQLLRTLNHRVVIIILLLAMTIPVASAEAQRRRGGRKRDQRKQDRNQERFFLDPNTRAPAGTRYASFQSPHAGGEYSYLVYLPPKYEAEPNKRYPVMYWLHGSGGNQRTGIRFVELLDPQIRASKVPPMIVILVNGVGKNLYLDAPDDGKKVESAIIQDLVPHVDKTYRTLATRESRGIEGFSMGGFGALHLAFKYPETFGVVSGLAPALVYPASGFKKVENAFQNSPLATSEEFFEANDPFKLADKNASALRDKMRIRLVVGDADSRFTFSRTQEMHAWLTKLKIKHSYREFPGVKHSYKKLYEIGGDEMFAFFREAFSGSK